MGSGQAASSLGKKFDADLDSIQVCEKVAPQIFLPKDEAAEQRTKIQIMLYVIESILVEMTNCEVHFRPFRGIFIHVTNY